MANKKKATSVVLTARQLLQGYTTDVDRRFLWNTMPYQMLTMEEKDEDWRKWNMDWLEYIGLRQILNENRRLVKNYHLANGVIDRSDYFVNENDKKDTDDLVNIITNETGSPFSLKFYPIIPNVINVLTGEFSKRDIRIIVKAVDEFSQNEAMQAKLDQVTQILIQNAQQQIAQQNLAGGQGPTDPNQQQQQMDAQAQLIQAEMKFKTYRSIPEIWAQNMIEYDDNRFNMYELESWGFRDSLVSDREFWHIDVKDDNYNVELWNPVYTFYHKSPDVYYIADGNFAGRMRLNSIPDVIDAFGSMMTEDQLENLKQAQSIAIRSGNVMDDAYRWDTTQYWDASKPYDEQQPNSVHFEQYVGMKNLKEDIEGLDWNRLNRLNDGIVANQSLVRVTEAYWRSQRKVGHLTWIKEDGTIIQEIVDENYKVTFKPVYDKSIVNKQSKDNLAYGEHIDWVWINEVWKGIKIGPNNTTYYQARGFGFEPIYCKIQALPFQFKGQDSLYGCKLPVEGRIFSERNSVSSSLVDKMKSHQIGFNIVNNQVMDFLADEVGKVVLIDQNMIPRNSLEGSWGRYNFPKFYQVMKDYQVAPVDSSLQNTESPATNFSHFQQVDLSKTDQILARLKLAEYFKNEAFAVVGITPQRLGEIQASESATGTQQAVNNSYSQTEVYFDQHMNHLMPRVRQMMLNAAQFINATKPESPMTYLNKKEETVWFQNEGYKLLLADYQIYAMSRANIKQTLEKLRQVAMENNTAGGSLFDIAQVITSDSPAEIIQKLKEAEDKKQQQQQAEQSQEQQMQQQQQQFEAQQAQQQQAHDDYWEERKIQRDIYVAEIRAAGQAQNNDLNNDAIPDALEVSKFLHEQGQSEQDINLKERKINLDEKQHHDNMAIQNKKIQAEKYKVDQQKEIAKMNIKNRPKSK
jgi:hypothetical protein